ncbi:response regulator transcription factor [Patescibacteria group bacterium]|nr:response regulator transcription factor [Patescibacteria group bacterium]
MSKKILIIEDEENILKMYKLRLEKEGYEVETAKNGAWGIKLAIEQKFDVIIMDIVMPAMNGCQVLKKLKIENKIFTPIIVVSNSAQDADIKYAKKCGADSYLIKSQITPTELVKEIKNLLRNS